MKNKHGSGKWIWKVERKSKTGSGPQNEEWHGSEFPASPTPDQQLENLAIQEDQWTQEEEKKKKKLLSLPKRQKRAS